MVTVQEIEQQQQDLEKTKQQAFILLNQPVPQRRFGVGITPEYQQAVLNQKTQAQIALSQINLQQQELSQSKSQLIQYQNDYALQQQAYKNASAEALEWQQAAALIKKGKTYAAGTSSVRNKIKYLREHGMQTPQEVEQRKRDAETVFINGQGYSVAPEKQQAFIESQVKLPGQNVSVPFQLEPKKFNVNQALYGGETEPYITEVTIEKYKYQGQEIPINEVRYIDPLTGKSRLATSEEKKQYFENKNVLNKPQDKKGLDKVQEFISKTRGTTKQGIQYEALKSFAGLSSSVLGTARFGKEVFTNPIGAGKSTIKGIINIPNSIKKLPQIVATEPSYSLGYTIGEYGQYKAFSELPKGINKAIDIYRVKGTNKLPQTEVIAPEYFKGQSYPTIKRGQTAGELLKEFKPTLPGEIKAGGYTAAPTSFEASTTAMKGSSELPGLYQAPKLSPKFLKVSGEGDKKLFSLNPLGTVKPTAIRITPIDYELISGVSKKQRGLTSLKQAKQFFEKAPKGKSYIPFIKTEKEAIIPAGTELISKGKPRYSFEFEGRKIPIQEFETLPDNKITIKSIKNLREEKVYTTEDISSLSSKGRVKSYSTTSPLHSYGLGKLSSSKSVYKSYSKLSSVSSSASYSNQISSISINKPSSSKTILPSSMSIPKKSSSVSTPSTSNPIIPSSTGVPLPPSPIKVITPAPPKSSFKFKIKNSLFGRGFRAFVIRKGKPVYVSGILPKGKALMKGESAAKSSLRATFGVKPTNILTNEQDIAFQPSNKIFRGYRIKQGKRIPLQDTFIQRRGKRLSFKGEIAEIQRSRGWRK